MSRTQLNIRLDDVSGEILELLISRTGDKKTKVVKDALEYYANYVLGHEELLNVRLYKRFDNKGGF